MTTSTRYVFNLNGYDDLDDFKSNCEIMYEHKRCRYIVFQEEYVEPTSSSLDQGYFTIQGYLELFNARSPAFVKRQLDNDLIVRVPDAPASSCINFCTDKLTRKSGTEVFSLGEPFKPRTSRRKRVKENIQLFDDPPTVPPLSAFNIAPQLMTKDKVLLFVGPTDIGIADYALAHFKTPCLIHNKGDFEKKFDPKHHDGLIFYMMSFREYNPDVRRRLVNGDHVRMVTLWHDPMYIPEGFPIIFISNNEDIFEDDPILFEGNRSTDEEMRLINDRVIVIEFKQPLYARLYDE